MRTLYRMRGMHDYEIRELRRSPAVGRYFALCLAGPYRIRGYLTHLATRSAGCSCKENLPPPQLPPPALPRLPCPLLWLMPRLLCARFVE